MEITKKKSLIIDKIIGSGGFGSVYKGKYGREVVAIKLVKSTSNGIPYLTEISIMSLENQEYLNISLKILFEDDNVYIIQPLALGDLHQWSSVNYISIGNKKRGIAQITKGMMYLHSIGVLHLDIKPNNILLYRKVFNGTQSDILEWKLADFGISKFNGSISKSMVCTSKYRPIEGWEKDIFLTPAIDYWSMGCTIHEIIYDIPIFSSQKVKKTNQKDKYIASIEEFFRGVYGHEKKSNLEYISPIIKYLKTSKDPMVNIIKEMMRPDKRNIIMLCDYLDLVYISPSKINPEDITTKTISRYIKSGGDPTRECKKVIEWMCRKLNDPQAPKPDVPLYKLLLKERKILSVLNYSII